MHHRQPSGMSGKALNQHRPRAPAETDAAKQRERRTRELGPGTRSADRRTSAAGEPRPASTGEGSGQRCCPGAILLG